MINNQEIIEEYIKLVKKYSTQLVENAKEFYNSAYEVSNIFPDDNSKKLKVLDLDYIRNNKRYIDSKIDSFDAEIKKYCDNVLNLQKNMDRTYEEATQTLSGNSSSTPKGTEKPKPTTTKAQTTTAATTSGNGSIPRPYWFNYSAAVIAARIWSGEIPAGFGDARRRFLEDRLGRLKAAEVQKELDKMAGTNTTQKPTTQPSKTVAPTSKPTTAKPTAKPFSTTKKPTTTTTLPKNTISKAPQSTAKPATKQPTKTVAPTSKPTPAPTTKPTKAPQQTTAPTVKPTTAPDPGGTQASQGVRSRLEDEIRRLREQLEKEQQERINLEQRVQQQQQQQAAQQQRQQTVTNYTARPEAAQVVQPEQATVAPTSTPAPAVVIPGSTDSGSTGSGNTGSGGSGTGYDSPSLPNPNAGDSGSGSSSSSSSSSGGFNPIPLGIGLGAAVAGGIGVKAYVDHKKNGKFDDENEDSVTNGNRFWTDEDPNVVHSEEDMLGDDSGSQDVSYQAVENSNPGNDTWNIEENELPDDNSFDLLSENN